jgi:hypothetical protein
MRWQPRRHVVGQATASERWNLKPRRKDSGRAIDPLVAVAALVVVDVMRRLVERRPPELVAAGVARHPQMPHAPAALVFFLRRGAQARPPPDLRHSGPQPVAEWAAMRLVIEHRYRHKMLMPHGTTFSRAGDARATPAAYSWPDLQQPSWSGPGADAQTNAVGRRSGVCRLPRLLRPAIGIADDTALHYPTRIRRKPPVLTFRLTSCQELGARIRRRPDQTDRPRLRPMISFWISVVPPKIYCTRLSVDGLISADAHNLGGEQRTGAGAGQGGLHLISASRGVRAVRSGRRSRAMGSSRRVAAPQAAAWPRRPRRTSGRGCPSRRCGRRLR